MNAIVFFDMETGGLHIDDDILQLAAKCGYSRFDSYVTPTQCVDDRATQVNGLSLDESDQLCRDGDPVSTRPLIEVLYSFLKFLKRKRRPCILVAHNCQFDAKRLLRKANECDFLDDFRSVIKGFTCTLQLARKHLPERHKSYSLVKLAKDLKLNEDEVDAHNAVYDVVMVERLVRKLNISNGELVRESTAFKHYE